MSARRLTGSPTVCSSAGGLLDELGQRLRNRRRERLAPIDAVGLDAQQRSTARQAVPKPRHIQKIDQPHFMNRAAARARQKSDPWPRLRTGQWFRADR